MLALFESGKVCPTSRQQELKKRIPAKFSLYLRTVLPRRDGPIPGAELHIKCSIRVINYHARDLE